MTNLNSSDSINNLYLALHGKGTNQLYSSGDTMLALYIDYINSLNLSLTNTGKQTSQANIVNNNISQEFIDNFRTSQTDIAKSARFTLTEDEIVDLINKLKNKDFNLTENQFLFITGNKSDDIIPIKELFDKINLPSITKLDKRLTEFKDIYNDINSDKYFSRDYEISNIYSVDTHFKVNNNFKNDSKTKMKRLVHGTTNHSLIQILANNFIRPSELFKKSDTNAVQSGQSLGDGIYFAQPSESSKVKAYIDRQTTEIGYIIVADVYYQKEVVTNTYSYRKLTGKNMVHGKSLGMYSRDEFVVLPNQIEIKYILEIRPKQDKR